MSVESRLPSSTSREQTGVSYTCIESYIYRNAIKITEKELDNYTKQVPDDETNPAHKESLSFFDLHIDQQITVYLRSPESDNDSDEIYMRAIVRSLPEIGPNLDDMWWIDTDWIDHRGRVEKGKRACLGVWGVTKCHAVNRGGKYTPDWNEQMYVLEGIHDVEPDSGIIYFGGDTACANVLSTKSGTILSDHQAA